MEQHPDLTAIQRKTFNFLDQDGLVEIFLGLTMLSFGATYHWHSPLYYVAMVAFVVLGVKSLDKIKKVSAFPRTGYVKFRQSVGFKPNVRPGLIVALCASSVYCLLIYLTGDISDLSDWGKWSPFLAGGTSAGAGLIPVYIRSKNPKTIFYAITGIALGIYLSIVHSAVTVYQGFADWSLWFGATMLLTGCILLIRFIVKYKPQHANEINER